MRLTRATEPGRKSDLERAGLSRRDHERLRDIGELARAAAEEARVATDAAHRAVMEAVRATAETLAATLENMRVVEDMRRTRKLTPQFTSVRSVDESAAGGG